MTSPACREVDEEVAVALLTRQPLPPAALRHLDDCPPCRQEWEQLSRVSRLLAATRDLELAPEVDAGPALLDRLLSEVARRRRRRWRAVTLAAAAAIVAVAVPLGLWFGHDLGQEERGPSVAISSSVPPGPGPVVARGAATAASSGIQADVEVRTAAWGSQVTVAASGMQRGTVCQIVVVDGHGRKEVAGSWTVTYEGGARVDETVHTAAPDIVQVNLVNNSTGSLLLAVPIA